MNRRIKNGYLMGMALQLKEEKWFGAEFWMSYFVIFIKCVFYDQVFRVLFRNSVEIEAGALTLYYIMVNVVAFTIAPAQYVAYDHMEGINSGAIIPFLLRPNSSILSRYCNRLTSVAVRLMVNLLLIWGVSWLLGRGLTVAAAGMGLLSILLGFTILYLIQAVIGCCTVWFRDITRFRDVIYSLLLILGGRLLPSELLFSGLKEIVYYTPLPYVYDVPVRVLMGDAPRFAIGMQVVWALLFGAGYLFLFERCVKHNMELGG